MPVDNELMQALNFTPNDLVSNHQGYLTDRQKDQLRRKELRTVLPIGVLIAVYGIGLLVKVLEIIQNPVPEPIQTNTMLLLLAFTLGLVALLTFAVFSGASISKI